VTSTAAYLSLLRALVINHNAFDESDLLRLLASSVLIRNPLLDCETRLSAEEKFAFSQAFGKIPSDPDWSAVQIALVDLILRVHRNATLAAVARAETELDPGRRWLGGGKMVNVGAVWCGFYKRPGLLSGLKYRAAARKSRAVVVSSHDAGRGLQCRAAVMR
jgi:hypothetical protein